jgi:CheY-like chemotaxis protein
MSSNKKRKNNNRILLVDDEPDISLLFKTVLKDKGFEVDSFEDPQVALSHLKPDFYDLVVLDIKMPDMNGFQLYREIKKIDSKLKVCFLTASEMFYEEYRRKQEDIASDVTAVDKDLFLLKPVSNQDLLQKISKIMTSH